ncbi:hypothetical protein BB561_001642 [Smittium simulii]|uniref:Uncharacterized protein n=1 Tax=Smittium simulii TaxID=133385 RepID=A0A2T9YTQ1_9FUNG|nr:hypothetical protein BB561_001642 [Smittium simulii]
MFRNSTWRKSTPSEKQVKFLIKLGIPKVLAFRLLGNNFPTDNNKNNSAINKIKPTKKNETVVEDVENNKSSSIKNLDTTNNKVLEKENGKLAKFFKAIGSSVDINFISNNSSHIKIDKGSAANLITRFSYGSGALTKNNIKQKVKQDKKIKDGKIGASSWL